MANYSNYVQTPVEGVQLFEVVTEPPSRDAAMIADNYLKLDGSVVSQSTYSDLFAETGLIEDLNFLTATWITTSLPAGQDSNTFVSDKTSFFVSAGIGDNRIKTSTNLINWTDRVTVTAEWYTAAYDNNSFVVAGVFSTASTSPAIYTSTNAINWTARSAPNSLSAAFVRPTYLAYGDNTWIIAPGTSTNNVRTSTDSITWTTSTSISSIDFRGSITGLNYVNNRFVAIRENILYTSTNILDWTAHTFTTITVFTSVQVLNKTLYENGKYIFFKTISNNAANIITSTDLITFSTVSFASGGFNWGMLYARNTFYAFLSPTSGNIGLIVSSTDGNSWVTTTQSQMFQVSPQSFRGVEFFKENQVALSIGSNIFKNKGFFSYNSLTDFLLPSTPVVNGLNVYVKAKP